MILQRRSPGHMVVMAYQLADNSIVCSTAIQANSKEYINTPV